MHNGLPNLQLGEPALDFAHISVLTEIIQAESISGAFPRLKLADYYAADSNNCLWVHYNTFLFVTTSELCHS